MFTRDQACFERGHEWVLAHLNQTRGALALFPNHRRSARNQRLLRDAVQVAGAALHVGDFYHIDVVGARAAGVDAWLIDAGGLYAEAACPRFPNLAAAADALAGR